MSFNFFKAAQNLGEFASGYAAGDAQRDKELATERMQLLQLGMSAGAQGIDAAGMVSPDMVSRGNRDYVAQVYPGMTGKFTQGFKDKLAHETALTTTKLDREEALWGKRMEAEQRIWDGRLAVQERMHKDEMASKDRYYGVLAANAKESADARRDAATARSQASDMLSYNAALKDRDNAEQVLETLALNKLRAQYGDAVLSSDGKSFARPEFARMVDEYKLRGMEHLEKTGAFSNTKSGYQPGQFRQHAAAFDKTVGYTAPEDNWFSANKPAGFQFALPPEPAQTTPVSAGGGDIFGQLSPLRDQLARLPEGERATRTQAAFKAILEANPHLKNNQVESQRVLGILSGKITR